MLARKRARPSVSRREDCAAPTLTDKMSKATLDNYADGKDLTAEDEATEATAIIKKCAEDSGATA